MAVAEQSPRYTSGIAVFSKNERNSYCFICPNKSPIASEEHLKNSAHLSRLPYYLHNFIENGPFVNCKLCSMNLEYSSIIEHAVTHKLMPWYRPQEEFKIFFINWISSKKNEYYCHLCRVKLSSWFHAILHTEETKHRALRGDKINEAAIRSLSFTLDYYRVVGHLENFMGISENSMCALCCVPSGKLLNNIEQHCQGIIHVRNMEKFEKILKEASVHVPSFTSSFNFDYYLPKVDDSEDKSDEQMIQISLSFCTVCHTVIDSSEIEAHLEKHADVPRSTSNATFQNISFPINKKIKPLRITSEENKTEGSGEDNRYECSCGKKLCRDEDLSQRHQIVRKSRLKVRKSHEQCETSIDSGPSSNGLPPKTGVNVEDDSLLPEGIYYYPYFYKCEICDMEIGQKMDIEKHVDTFYHQRDLRLKRENEGKTRNNELKSCPTNPPGIGAGEGLKVKNSDKKANTGDIVEGIRFLFDTLYRCTLCQCHINGRVNVQEHVDAPRHQEQLRLWKENKEKISDNIENTKNDQILPRDVVRQEDSNFFRCKTCSAQITGYNSVLQHVNGLKHINRKLVTSKSMVNTNSDASNSNSRKNSIQELAPQRITKESIIKNDSEKTNHSLPSTSTSKVNIEDNKTSTTKKKRTREPVVKISSSENQIKSCEIHPENKKSPGQTNSFKCDSCNIKLRGYAELLSHVMSDECKPSTIKKANESESYKFAEASPGKLRITKFVEGKEVEAVDVPAELLRITRRNYYCLSCRCNLIGGESIFEHAKATAHRESVLKRNEDDQNYIFTQESSRKRKIAKLVDGKVAEAVDIPEIFMRITDTNYYCIPCCCHLNGGESILNHAKTVHREDSSKKNEEGKPVDESAVIDSKSGLIGNVGAGLELPPHIIAAEEVNHYWCQICSIKINGYKSVSEHVNGSQHRKNMNTPDSIFDPSLFPDITVIPGKDNQFWCKVCSVKIHGPKTVSQHVIGRKHIKQVEDSSNLSTSHDLLPRVSDGKNGESITITSKGINWKTNNYLASSSLPSPEKYALYNDKISLNSIAGGDYGKLNNNKELMRESVKSIYSPSDEVLVADEPSDEALISASLVQLNLNSEEAEKELQDTEVFHSEGSWSSLSYGRHEDDDWIQLCPGSDESVDYYRIGDFMDEYTDESASTSQLPRIPPTSQIPKNASTSQMPKNIRVPEKVTASSLGEGYNIEGTEIWLCLVCRNDRLYTPESIIKHLDSDKHAKWREKILLLEPRPLNNTNFRISPEWQSEGIVAVPTESFAVCTLCRVKLTSRISVNEHLPSAKHEAHKRKVSVKDIRNERKLKSIEPLPPQPSLLNDFEKTRCYILLKKLKKKPQQALNDLKSMKKIPNYVKILPEGVVKLEKIDANWCLKCQRRISAKDLPVHLSSKKHKEKAVKNEQIQGMSIFHCELCNRDVIGKESWEGHILGADHRRNERELLGASSPETSSAIEIPKKIQPLMSSFQLSENNPLKQPETYGSHEREDVRISQKYQPMVDCNICHCKIPGGDTNVTNHRNTREHKDNESKLFAPPTTSTNSDNSVRNASPVDPRSFNAKIPLDAHSQYHSRADKSMDFIECKACNINIYGIGNIPSHYVYAYHVQSEMHKIKEMEFTKNGKPSPVPSASDSRSSAKSSRKSSGPIKKKGERGRSMQKLRSFGERKFMCPICSEKLSGMKELHSHLTNHFWKRFTKNPPPVTEEAPEESVVKSEISKCNDADDETSIIESPKKNTKQLHYRRKPLDIEVTGSLNIYEIDKQKMNEIKVGVLLSLPKDKDTIYCLICRGKVSNDLQAFYEHLCSVKHLDYLEIMWNDNELFKNCENQFSDLALGYEYMEDISNTAVKCHACNISVKNQFPTLYDHITSGNHIDKWTTLAANSRELFRRLKPKMECDFYSVRKYWCVICGLKFITEYEFQKHLGRTKHLKETQKFSDEFLMFDYCGICASLWYGFMKTFSYHSDCKLHKYHKSDGFFSINRLPESAEHLLDSPGEGIEAILRGSEFRRAIDKKKEEKLLLDLKEIAVVEYPNVVIHPFGSRITGLGGKNSDLDIFLDCPIGNSSMYFGENSRSELIERRLLKIKECLETKTNIWHIDREIFDCRIPIIKVKHKPTDIDCDLSFTNGLASENTALITNYCDKSKDCRKLIIFIKNWMNQCELSGVNGIQSYGTAWLVIYFLQAKRILPSVNQLIEMNNKSQVVAGWETGVSKDFQAQTFDGSFGELLNEFFKFYGNFDYRHDVICPLLGEIVKKTDFQHRGKLPSTMGPYLNYLHDIDNSEPFRVDSIMCLQDPFDLAHNITKAVKKFNIYKFKTFCCYSADILDNNH